MIDGFALGNTGKILYRLKNIGCCYLVFPNNINHYLDLLLHDQPLYLLGLGSYSGVDQDKIRVETLCSNQFRNNYDGDKRQEILIKPFLKPNSQAKFAKAIRNSYCNLVSWKIMQLIQMRKLRSQYTFLHIPKTMKPWIASQTIDEVLAEVKSNLK